MDKFLLKLYVTGDTPRAERAIANLRQICERELPDQYELVIVDVLENPQMAEREKIMVTPTLIRELPPPRRRIIGDLTDTARVLLGLNLQHSEHQGDA
jgi:circadian clock protein KaiB